MSGDSSNEPSKLRANEKLAKDALRASRSIDVGGGSGPKI
jgi:hypothetical protein